MNILFASLLASASKKLFPLATPKAAVERSQPFFILITFYAMCDFKNKYAIHPVMLRKPIG